MKRAEMICYFYVNGKVDKVSEWKKGKEVNVLKRFEGNKMIEFVNGLKRYEWEYRDSIKQNYPREGEGEGEEYDIDGEDVMMVIFWNGDRQGHGKLYGNSEVVYNGIWMKWYRLNGCFSSIQVVFGCKKSKTFQMNNDLNYTKQLDSLSNYFGDIIVIFILFFLIIPFQPLHKQYVGSNGIDWIESL